MISKDIGEQIASKYTAAVANGDVVFTETEQHTVKDPETNMNYAVKFIPSASEKPAKKDSSSEDPFANPDPALVVSDIGEKFTLLLNKYPVVPNHTLLVTKTFQSQDSLVTPEELTTAYKLLRRLDEDGKRHMMFYNSGPLSGSSQKHKHLQFIELPEGFKTLQDNQCNGESHFFPTNKKEPLQNKLVSFAHYTVPLPSSDEVDEDLLAMTSIALMQRTLDFFRDWTNDNPDLQGKRSYNVLMTKDWISVVPRSSTTAKVFPLDFNATAYAGLVLTKDQEAYESIKKDPHNLDLALLECGFLNNAGQKTNEYNY